MKMKTSVIVFLMTGIIMASCSKKTIPEETVKVEDSSASSKTNETTVAPSTKAVSAKEYSTGKRKVSGTNTPKYIVVDDRNAKSTADGKLYYDLGGRRYWKSNKDGKYYLDGIFATVGEKSKKKN
jgi:hypothetical protein